VLLFVNLNNDKENEYVSDGMIEEIINNATSSGSGAGGQPRETSAEKSVPDGIRRLGVGAKKLNRDATLPRTFSKSFRIPFRRFASRSTAYR